MLLYNYNTSTLFYHTPMNIHRILLAKYNNYDNKMYLYSIHFFHFILVHPKYIDHFNSTFDGISR